MNSENSQQRRVISSPWWNKVVSQAISLANDAAHTQVGKKLKEQVDQIVEEARPQMAKVVKNYANEVANPYQLGMGMEVVRLEDEVIETVMPHRWRNRDSSGSVHNSAYSALAEFTSQTFWEQRLNHLQPSLSLLEIHGHFFETSFRRVRATMEVAGEFVQEKTSLLNSKGSVEIPSTVIVRKRGDAKVAEFHLVWKVKTEFRMRAVEFTSVN